MERVVGVDVARGVAVLGMVTAHVGDAAPGLTEPSSLLGVADGRSAATFALLAGVSLALVTGGRDPVAGRPLARARVRLLVRCLLLWVLGAGVIALGTPVAVILPQYAVVLALLTTALVLPRRALLVLAGTVAVAGPPVVLASRRLLAPDGLPLPQPLDVLVGEHYPVAVWAAYVLVGIAVGRTDLREPRTPRRLAAVGVVAAVVGYGTGVVGTRLAAPTGLAHDLLTPEAHADTTTEVVGNVGVTLLLLAGCLVAVRTVPRLLTPVAATGALALTAYVGHLVAIALLGDDVVWQPSNGTLLVFVVVVLAGTTAWRATLGRGPLERLLHLTSTSLAGAVVPDRPAREGRVAPTATR